MGKMFPARPGIQRSRPTLLVAVMGTGLLASCGWLGFDNSPPLALKANIQYKSAGICPNPQLINTSIRKTNEGFQLQASVPPSNLVIIGNQPPNNVANLDLTSYAKGTERDVRTKGYIYYFSHLYSWNTPKENVSYDFELAFKCDESRPEAKITVPATPTSHYLIVQEDASQPSGYTLTVTSTEPADWN